MVGLSLTLAMTVACGKSDAQIAAEKTAEEAKVAAEAVKKAAESAASSGVTQGLEGFAKAMEGVAGMANALGGAPGGKPVDPISFKELQTALPEVAGWERQKPTGERMTMPVAFSQAEARYTKGEARVEVKIVDSAFHQLLVAPWSMFLTVGYEKETSDGYEKSVNVSGSPGFEKWNDNRKDGELNLVVAKRFLVTVEGDGVGDIAVLREFASKLDTGKLASLK
jgi:hypothetical protein